MCEEAGGVRARRAWTLAGALCVALGGCQDGGVRSGRAGDTGADSAAAETGIASGEVIVATDIVDVDALQETVIDEVTVAEVETTETIATAPDTGTDSDEVVDPPVCGNGLVEGREDCDDGNACDNDGCGAVGCHFEPSAILTRLALSEEVAFDLDGDGKPDNLLGGSTFVAEGLSQRIASYIEDGRVMQLVTLGGVGGGSEPCGPTRNLTLVLHPGSDASCPPHAPPFPWLDSQAPPTAMIGDADAFDACTPRAAIGPLDGPDNGLYAATFAPGQPAAPLVHMTAPSLALPLGPLGLFTIAGAHLDATCVADSGRFVGLRDGRLGGVVPAAALYAIDTSDILPACPTALHAVLGLAGHLDQDGDHSGGKDFILWTTSPGGVPCLTAPVVTSGCCDDGDCQGGMVSGEDCANDSRIGDGFSAGFAFEAHAVHIVGHAPFAVGPVCEPR